MESRDGIDPVHAECLQRMRESMREMGTLLAQVQRLLAQIDQRERLARGEDGFDGY